MPGFQQYFHHKHQNPDGYCTYRICSHLKGAGASAASCAAYAYAFWYDW